MADTSAHCVAAEWKSLPAELVQHVASFFEPNEVACTLRLVDKSTAKHLEGWTRVRLSQPVPHHAFAHRWRDEGCTHGMTLKQRRQLLCLVARSGSIPNLEVAVTAAGCTLNDDVCGAASAGGHIHVCDWLRDRGCRDFPIRCAAESGSSAMVRWVLQQESDISRGLRVDWALVTAARAGHRALCEELLAEVPVEGREVAQMKAAYGSARGGHLELTQWLLGLMEDTEAAYGELLVDASYSMDLPALQIVYGCLPLQRVSSGRREEIMSQWGPEIAFAALASPTPDWRAKLQWLEDTVGARPRKGAMCDRLVDICKRPDAMERIAVLRQWDVARGGGILQDAVVSGSLPVVRYLLVEGCTIRPKAVRRAARYGHLHMLRWLAGPEASPAAAEALRAAEADKRLTCCGAQSGSLELMQWLRERDCQWDEKEVFWAAVEAGNVALLEWLGSWGCSMRTDGKPYRQAACFGDLATLRCLRRMGCPWGSDRIFSVAVVLGCRLEVLRLMVAEGSPVDWREAVEKARHRGDEEVITWAEEMAPSQARQ